MKYLSLATYFLQLEQMKFYKFKLWTQLFRSLAQSNKPSIKKRCLLAARGPSQFIAGLNAMEWHVKHIQGLNENVDYYLLLYGFGVQNDNLYDITQRMSQIREWKNIYILNEEIESDLLNDNNLIKQIDKLKKFINEDYFNEIYLSYDHGGIEGMLMNIYHKSQNIIYGDQFGMLTEESIINQRDSLLSIRNIYILIIRKLKRIIKKVLGIRKRNFDLAVLATPIDWTDHLINQIPLIIPSRNNILQIIKQIHENMPDFKEYYMNLIGKSPADTYLYLLSHFNDNKEMTSENEIKMYNEIIHKFSPSGSTILLKPHPRTSSDFFYKLIPLLEKDYEVKTVTNDKYSGLSIELWIHLIANCTIVNLISSSCINIKYLYGKSTINALDEYFIKKYAYHDAQELLLKYSLMNTEVVNRLENWDGKSVLWKNNLK